MTPLDYGILGSSVFAYLSLVKMSFDFEVRGKDTIFSRAFIPFYNLIVAQKITDEIQFQKELKYRRDYQKGTLESKFLNSLNN